MTLNGNNAGGIEYDPDLSSYATHGGSASAIAGTQLVADNHVNGAGNYLEGVKVDIDKNQALVRQLTQLGLPLQSVPTVAAFGDSVTLSLSLIVTLTVLSIKVTMAMPIPA